MDSINFVVLGEQSIANDFGKKGTETDLTLYDRKEFDIIRTWVTPNGFPEKIQPLFQAINLAEYPIVYLGMLDRFTGEQIIALDSLRKKDGILSHTYEVDETRLSSMIKGTVLQNYKKVASSELKSEINKFKPFKKEGKVKIIIDHCFDVKGVGTVVLGKVTQGAVKQYDILKLLPLNIDVTIKSIQMHDESVSEAVSPARVGLSLKGVKPEQVSRGDILCADESIQLRTAVELDFKKNQFYKGVVSENQGCLVSVGLQIKAAKFSTITPLILSFEKPIVCEDGEICVILKPESQSIRILGSGKIK